MLSKYDALMHSEMTQELNRGPDLVLMSREWEVSVSASDHTSSDQQRAFLRISIWIDPF
jgi:hypothetical protein